jgi:photosystem II stability/assembly factor-like uncharacterized protein
MRIAKRLSVCLIFFVVCFFESKGQKISIAGLSSWKPRMIGPAGMSGRITSVDALPDDPNFILLGSASGGIWKTGNGGARWTPLFDEQPIQNIGSVAIQYSNPAVLWAGTGEGNPRNSINIGEGIYKSLNGGKDWLKMGLEKTRNIHRILINPVEPNTVYAGAIGNPYGVHSERGVFKTTDGGETWKKILYTNDTSGVADMIMDPSNPEKLLVGMWQHKRTPWSFTSGGPGSGLFMTLDGGKNWKKLGVKEGLPDGNYGRIGLAASKSNPKRIYALIESQKNGLYRTDDGGYTWELINDNKQWVTNRPFYFQEIACDPQNDNRLWLIYQMIAVSEDGGANFKVVLPYNGIHPDHHAFWINPKNPDFIIDGNDGGIGITRDRGKSWQFDDKIPVGQFYHINVDNEMPYNVMGGMQDNGSWRGPSYTWVNEGIRNYNWHNLSSGDGFDVMPDAADASWVYTMAQEGYLSRYNTVTGESWFIKPPDPDEKTFLRFNWNAALAQDPFDPSTIFYGSQFLHKSVNKGASWDIISPDLTTNDSAKIDQSNNGGLSIDITGAENYCTILAIEPSPKEKGVIWIGTDDGNVQLTRDGGKSWVNFRGKIPGMPTGCWVPQIRASKHNAAEAFVVCNDYRRADFSPYIFRTTDYGKTWTRLVDEKKVKGYALCVLQDPAEPNLIFVGTENGLWISTDNGTSFEQWKNNYPSVSTYDLAIQEREADLVIATFGRAIWVLDNIMPLRKIAAAKNSFKDPFVLFPSVNAVMAQYKNAPGYEWSTYGLWEAENKQYGAAISWYINPKLADTLKGKKISDTVWVNIFDSQQQLVRTLQWKTDTGFNRRFWHLEEKGFRSPGSEKPKAGGAEPSGSSVLSGKYKLVVRFKNYTDSVAIEVLDDPRLGNRNDIKKAQKELQQKLYLTADKLTAGIDNLNDADAATKKIADAYKGNSGKEANAILKLNTAMQDSIKSINAYLKGKSETRQGYGQIPQFTVLGEFRNARESITAKTVKPGEQEQRLVNRAIKVMDDAVSRINTFLDGAWKNFKAETEKTKPDFFNAR